MRLVDDFRALYCEDTSDRQRALDSAVAQHAHNLWRELRVIVLVRGPRSKLAADSFQVQMREAGLVPGDVGVFQAGKFVGRASGQEATLSRANKKERTKIIREWRRNKLEAFMAWAEANSS